MQYAHSVLVALCVGVLCYNHHVRKAVDVRVVVHSSHLRSKRSCEDSPDLGGLEVPVPESIILVAPCGVLTCSENIELIHQIGQPKVHLELHTTHS